MAQVFHRVRAQDRKILSRNGKEVIVLLHHPKRKTKLYIRLVALLALFVGLSACSGIKIPAFDKITSSETKPAQFARDKTPAPTIIRVSGYSTYPVSEKGVMPQERLKAIRASKLDAYRTLAERIYGVTVAGESSVSNHELQGDGVKTMVDSMVRGARVVSISESKDGLVETVMELSLEGSFKACLSSVNQLKNDPECRMPLSMMGDMSVSDQSQSKVQQQHYHIN